MDAQSKASLVQLARMYGIQSAYRDNTGIAQYASREALLRVLQALGAPVMSECDVSSAVRQRRQELWRQVTEPVGVAWEGRLAEVEVRLPVGHAQARVECQLTLEGGEARRWDVRLSRQVSRQSVSVEGVRYVSKRLALRQPLPLGYHHLAIDVGGRRYESMIIAAPRKAYVPFQAGAGAQWWGVFLPLYALHTEQSWGAGDLGDLERLMDWAHERGGGVTATLPMLAAFLDQPFEASPYRCASRLFWNELYIDLWRVPEAQRSPEVADLLRAPGLQREVEELRAMHLVDYRRQMRAKRTVLETMARSFFKESSGRDPAVQSFLVEHPQAEDYASFRAVCDKRGASWQTWPQPLSDGALAPSDYDEQAKRYHLYAQWRTSLQMEALAEKARRQGPGLYIDLPLGVHPDSYDVWRSRVLFALGCSTGAPPDDFFSKGQDWGVPPLHPQRVRAEGYRYVIAYLRHFMRQAGVLRIDHVMGLHRLFWIPQDFEARQGVYVRYPAEESYAILALESHRHRCWVVGENLGTVPTYVHRSLERHGLGTMYVLQFEARPDPEHPLRPVPANAVASLNTHDTAPFAAYWRGDDIQERVSMGLLEEREAEALMKSRDRVRRAMVEGLRRQGFLTNAEPGVEHVARACLTSMAAGGSPLVLINLEDLWAETERQNTPGTGQERPNWRRKARYSFEEFSTLPQVLETLQTVARWRNTAAPEATP